MAIKMLTPEQVRSMTLEEKDEWWLKNVYRGGAPQLTLRSALTGMALGGLLSVTNLYISARTGWLLGVGITSVVLSFAAWRALAKLRVGRDMTVLENNAVQSIATAAGYMTAPLTSSLGAYTMVTGKFLPMYVAFLWMICMAALGILFAFPMKKRFINDDQLPFPEGMAAGVVMDSLHTSDAKEGLFKAKLLIGGGLLSSLVELLRSEKLLRFVAGVRAIPAYYDEILYRLGVTPKILGTSLADLTIRFDTSVIFVATGGLAGMRIGVSMLLGATVNYVVLAPILIQQGVILPGEGGHLGFWEITQWALWPGTACMTTASLYAFFSRPAMLVNAARALFSRRRAPPRDALAHIELPIQASLVGVPVLGVLLALICYLWLDVPMVMSLIAVPLVFVFSLIAVSVTAITSITPSSVLAQLTQLFYGVVAPGKLVTNLVTAGIASEVSANAANLLMDIKPGYMLGAKPRLQAIGHFLGAIAGVAIAVPVWYVLTSKDPARLGTTEFPMPAANSWKGVSEILMKGLSFLHPTAKAAVVVGAIAGVVFEAWKQITKDRFPISAIGFGLAFVLQFSDVLTIFLGGLAFWLIERAATRGGAGAIAPSPDVEAHAPPAKVTAEEVGAGPRAARGWVAIANENRDTICAGVIAGGSLTGIALMIANVWWLPEVGELTSMAPDIVKAAAALRAGPGGG